MVKYNVNFDNYKKDAAYRSLISPKLVSELKVKIVRIIVKKKKYKEHFALDHVSFQVNKGETVGIIGTNGSGKSTILKIITGVLNPTVAEVVVEGRIYALLELGAGFNMQYT